jgi:hypothetical protein
MKVLEENKGFSFWGWKLELENERNILGFYSDFILFL